MFHTPKDNIYPGIYARAVYAPKPICTKYSARSQWHWTPKNIIRISSLYLKSHTTFINHCKTKSVVPQKKTKNTFY